MTASGDANNHTNSERILYNAVQTAYWLCEDGQQDTAHVVLTAALDAYEPRS
jgi:hypothetical protein